MTSETPLSSFTTRRKIEFADTDMGGIVHFARFFVFLETAEHEFLEAIGTTVHHRRDGHEIGWPRVSASLEYQSPARLGDDLTIELRVARKGTRSMTYDFAVRVGEVTPQGADYATFPLAADESADHDTADDETPDDTT